ncbi:MAG: sigma-70 family RNA polymerase sigma factor [Oscillospiraceae bacterium]|nr:sigma-70 family RNA polymerase sigma factor [Oscillospiraceae bacterium]
MIDYPALSDTELLQRSNDGDEAAADTLILRYNRLIKSCARSYFLAGGDSEDLQQEGMIGLLTAMREFDPDAGASFRTFAELCIRRRIISAAKSASRMKHSPLNSGISLEEILSAENQSRSPFLEQSFDRSPEDQVLAREREGNFLSAYSRYLSAFEKEILQHYLNGLSYGEIAKACGCSEKSVDNAVQRIRKKLARHKNLGDFS